MESSSVNYPIYQSYAISMNVDNLNCMKFSEKSQIQRSSGSSDGQDEWKELGLKWTIQRGESGRFKGVKVDGSADFWTKCFIW